MPNVWNPGSDDPEDLLAIARLVDFGECGSLVDQVSARAYSEFRAKTAAAFPSFAAALESADPPLRRTIAQAVYEAARLECGPMRYENERHFDYFSGRQQVRTPAETARDGEGTCLDLAVLLAALLARVGLEPSLLIVFASNPSWSHALVLVRLAGDAPRDALVHGHEAIIDRVARENAIAVECTGLVGRQLDHGFEFDVATAKGDEVIQLIRSRQASGFAVDVALAWASGFDFLTPNSPQRLRELLRPIDFDPLVDARAAEFVGRHGILEDIDRWQSDTASPPVFWLSGEQGIGKSEIAAAVCRRLRDRDRLGAMHFFQAGDPMSSSPSRAAMSMAWQLSRQGGRYRWRLANSNLDAVDRWRVAELLSWIFTDLFKDAPDTLRPAMGESPRSPGSVVVVIDALDEASTDGSDELIGFVRRAWLGQVVLPPHLKLFVTSLPGLAPPSLRGGVGGHLLSAGDPANLADVETYLRQALCAASASDEVHPLVERSEGNLLWASLAARDLRDHVSPAVVPRGFSEIHHLHLSRLEERDPDGYRNVLRPLLELVVAAFGPLPLGIAALALGVDEQQLRVRLRPLEGHLELAAGGLRHRHRYFVEWLMDADSSGTFHVRQIDGHTLLGDACWRALHGRSSLPALERDYCLDHLPEHLLEAGMQSRLEDLLCGIQCVHRWMATGRTSTGIRILRAAFRQLAPHDRGGAVGADFAVKLAQLYSRRGEYADAENWLGSALTNTSGTHGRRLRSIALHELGSIALYRAEHARARELYEQALELVAQGDDVDQGEVAANLIGIGSLASAEQTLSFAREAVVHAQAGGDLMHEVAGERLCADACHQLDRLEEGLRHVDRALHLCETSDDVGPERIQALLTKGFIQYAIALRDGRPLSRAIDSYRAALDAAIQSGLYMGQVSAKVGVGLCELAQGHADHARAIWFAPLSEALPQGQELDAHAAIGLGLARASHQLRQATEAAAEYERVLELCAVSPDGLRPWRIQALIGLGAVCWHRAEHEQAERRWQQAIELSRQVPYRLRMTQINIVRARADPCAAPW